MGGELIGLVAVTLGWGSLSARFTPITRCANFAARALAAIAAGVEIPVEPELVPGGAFRRWASCSFSGALGYIATFD